EFEKMMTLWRKLSSQSSFPLNFTEFCDLYIKTEALSKDAIMIPLHEQSTETSTKMEVSLDTQFMEKYCQSLNNLPFDLSKEIILNGLKKFPLVDIIQLWNIV